MEVNEVESCDCTFCDTKEREQVFEEVKDAKTIEETLEKLNKYYPDWISASFTGYSKDYPTLDKNWGIMCKKVGFEKKEILLVKSIIFDDNHKILCRAAAGPRP